MGYSEQQLADLEATVQACDADVVLVATPVDLSRLLDLGKPAVRARYSIAERGTSLPLSQVIEMFCTKFKLNTKPMVR
jgi:predicted GTPase